MYDDLITAIRKTACQFKVCGMCPKGKEPCIDRYALQAADAIEELSKPKWISVTERLPEIGTYIIAGRMKYDYEKAYTHFVDVAYFGPRWDDANYSWQTFNDWREGQQEFEITHWMPLPPPPKEETSAL